jgi:hypothetical protein
VVGVVAEIAGGRGGWGLERKSGASDLVEDGGADGRVGDSYICAAAVADIPG